VDERRGRFVGPSTAEAIRTFQQDHRLETTGVVDGPTADAIPPDPGRLDPTGTATTGVVVGSTEDAWLGVIRGHVMTSAKTSVPDVAVAAFVVGLGREERIAEGSAGSTGDYRLEYARDALATNGRG